MEERLKTLLQRLNELADLDEGRRDLEGTLTRAAFALRHALDADRACAAFGNCLSLDDVDGTRAETWTAPGELGRQIIESREGLAWSHGASPEPCIEDRHGDDEFKGWMGAPILPDGEQPGLLCVMGTEPFSDRDRELLNLVADLTTTAIGNLSTFQEVESLSVTDELTRVYNYRFLKAALRREVERASRYGQVFSILMIDVDHLKKFNEVNGHLRGSELLRQLAAILRERSRAIDLVAKYGGDEFLIILPQTNTDGAESMGWRICDAVAEHVFSHCNQGQITISTGVSSFPHHGGTVQTLLAAADQALFEAKRKGRNCVVAAQGPASPGRLVDAA